MTPSILEPGEAPPVGTVIDDRFKLERFLGAGGMAVYEAIGPDGSRVALKILLGTIAAASKEANDRFRRETELAISSEHVVCALEAGVDRALGCPFMVMPLLVGFDLDAVIEKIGPVHPTVAVRIARQACLGLVAAHAAGIVHRDVKPANLFLAHGEDGRITVRVLDFGIAKAPSTSSLTATGGVLGTPHFMSPEQLLDSKRVDARSDVWSVAMTLYYALAGGTPFEAESLAELVRDILERPIKNLQALAPWVDPGLARIVHGALVRDVDARCPTAAELAEALEPFAFGDGITASMFVGITEAQRALSAPVVTHLPASWLDATEKAAVVEPALELPETEDDPLLSRLLGGKYKLLRRLGDGGMGVVYEAEDAGGRRVAVKVIRPELAGTSGSARKRFVREAQVLQSFTSPHVVQVLEVGVHAEGELPFIVMELLMGTDLERALARGGHIEPSAAARIFGQAARGLADVHAKGFVHRDIKPGNIFVCHQPNGRALVKICDFGVAMKLETAGEQGKLTRTGGVIGSPMYMAPEQAGAAKDLDHRVDVWSLGVALFEALAGTSLWDKDASVAATIVALTSKPIPRLGDRAPWVPAELARIVDKALQRAPVDRFASAGELAAALESITGGQTAVRVKDLELRGESDAAARPRDVAAADTHAAETATLGARVHAEVDAARARALAAQDPPVEKRRSFLVPALAGVAALAVVAVVMKSRSGAADSPDAMSSIAPASPSASAMATTSAVASSPPVVVVPAEPSEIPNTSRPSASTPASAPTATMTARRPPVKSTAKPTSTLVPYFEPK